MSNYIGVRCPVCNKKFTEADDIVVCPVCGAPHHRDCYNQGGQCHFVADHLSGKEWRDPAGEVPPYGQTGSAQRPKICTRCGASNSAEQIFCQVCGNPLAIQPQSGGQQPGGQQPPYGPGGYAGGQQQSWGFPGYQQPVDTISMAYGGLPPEETIEGETVKDIAQYVGSGSAYYLPRFQMLAEHAKAISLNFSALIFGFLYYFYRKMYMLGSILLALYLASRIPYLLLFWETFPEFMNMMGLAPKPILDTAYIDHLVKLNYITSGINFFVVTIMAFLSNRLYFNRVIAAVHSIRTSAGEGPETQPYSSKLAMRGGKNIGAVVAVLATIMAGSIVASSAMLNAYSKIQVSQGEADAASTQSAVVSTLPEEAMMYEEESA